MLRKSYWIIHTKVSNKSRNTSRHSYIQQRISHYSVSVASKRQTNKHAQINELKQTNYMDRQTPSFENKSMPCTHTCKKGKIIPVLKDTAKQRVYRSLRGYFKRVLRLCLIITICYRFLLTYLFVGPHRSWLSDSEY